MNFDDTPEEAAYRAQVRSYIEAHSDQLPCGLPTLKAAAGDQC